MPSLNTHISKLNSLLSRRSIASGLLVAGILAILKLIDWKFSTEILKKLWNFIIEILVFRVPVWSVLSIILLSILLYYVIRNISASRKTPPRNIKKYTSVHLFEVYWTWKWNYDKAKDKFDVSDLVANCVICETRLVEQKCPRCRFKPRPFINKSFTGRRLEQDYREKAIAIIEGDIKSRNSMAFAKSRDARQIQNWKDYAANHYDMEDFLDP